MNPMLPRRLTEMECRDRAWQAFAFVTVDRTSVIRFANSSLERLFGYLPGELAGQPLCTIMVEPFAGRHGEFVSKFFESAEPRPMTLQPDIPARKKSGDVIHVTVALSSFFDESNEQLAIACVSEVKHNR